MNCYQTLYFNWCYRPQTWQLYIFFPALSFSSIHKIPSSKFKGWGGHVPIVANYIVHISSQQKHKWLIIIPCLQFPRFPFHNDCYCSLCFSFFKSSLLISQYSRPYLLLTLNIWPVFSVYSVFPPNIYYPTASIVPNKIFF